MPNYNHTKPLNTVSVILMDESDNIFTVQSGKRKSLIGGWITRDYDGPHSVNQAMDSVYEKIVQETNNGDDKESIQEFYRNHNIQIMDSFSYDCGNYGHFVAIVRYLEGETPLMGKVSSPNRYTIDNSHWLELSDFKSRDIKNCSRTDVKKMVSRGIPLF